MLKLGSQTNHSDCQLERIVNSWKDLLLYNFFFLLTLNTRLSNLSFKYIKWLVSLGADSKLIWHVFPQFSSHIFSVALLKPKSQHSCMVLDIVSSMLLFSLALGLLSWTEWLIVNDILLWLIEIWFHSQCELCTQIRKSDTPILELLWPRLRQGRQTERKMVRQHTLKILQRIGLWWGLGFDIIALETSQ